MIVRPESWIAQPWANGGGVTHEIARWPEGGAPFEVRASLAEVTRAGPFSRFPGHRRWSVLAADAPIELRTPMRTYVLARRGAVVELDGDEAIEAALVEGPTHLFNVLARVPVTVGVGPRAAPVRLAFALEDTPGLARWHARLEAASVTSAGVVWIA